MISEFALRTEEAVIARIKADLRIMDTTEHDTYLEILLREGLGSVNAISQLVKDQCDLKVSDCKVELPKGLVKFIALRSKTWLPSDSTTDTSSNPPCQRLLYADLDFLNSCGCSTNGLNSYKSSFQINKNYIHFNDDDSQLDEVTIAYLGMWLDENKKPVIFERFERALTAYACWKFTRSWSDRYNQYVIDSYQREWVNQKDFLRGIAVSDEFNRNKREISEMMRAWIVSPIVNY